MKNKKQLRSEQDIRVAREIYSQLINLAGVSFIFPHIGGDVVIDAGEVFEVVLKAVKKRK